MPVITVFILYNFPNVLLAYAQNFLGELSGETMKSVQATSIELFVFAFAWATLGA